MGNRLLQPIFIGGCERSGTTFLGAMLGANEKAITPPEAQFIIETMKKKSGKIIYIVYN